jgi:DNA (cytosine-5)-methyltransferase 1
MRKLKVLDTFAGVGGFSLGLESTGYYETIAFCEIDKYANMVLDKHWPDIPKFNDIKELRYENGELIQGDKRIKTEIDVICGGFPCVDISICGQKRGLLDENGQTTRSGLWFEYARLINEIKPTWVIIENVRNLLNLGMVQVLKDIDEAGYNCEWNVISARDVGACHLRERIWIVAWKR